MENNVSVYRPPAQRLIRRILRPFQEFAHREASSGISLLVCMVVALVWANSPWAQTYTDLWHAEGTIGIGPYALSKSLLHWINDGLMVIFFFVVGLEIKRELLAGELASVRRAALPIAAAIGGMVVPASIYAALNRGTAGVPGWGIPMATDIAFALGALALLGNRIPLSLKVFLTALAIVDDIGAVLVIAVFYTTGINWSALIFGGMIFGILYLGNRIGVRDPKFYVVFGAGLWLAFLESGVHATIAGILLAMTIPAYSRIHPQEFLDTTRQLLEHFQRDGMPKSGAWVSAEQRDVVLAIEEACEQVETPLQRFEHALHPWVTFLIMPIFALANAGVSLQGNLVQAWTHPVSLGAIAGLVIGKQIGITAASWLAVKSRIASLPSRVTWQQVYGVSWLGGIGFTMSLFIASLAFGESELLTSAKLGILTASVFAGVVGWLLLRQFSAQAVESQDDVEDTAA